MIRFTLRGQEVARRLGAELRAIPVPDTEAGRGAGEYLQAYARESLETMAEEEHHVRDLPEDVSLLQSIRGLQRLELAFLDAFGLMTTADGVIKSEIPELREPFEKADSCKELDALKAD